MQKATALLSILFLASAAQAQQHADCITAMDICKKQVYHIDKTGGEGQNNHEADFIACFMNSENFGNAEENSTWIKFDVAKSGSLSFAITPHRLEDDIDFVVYLMLDGTCNNMKIVRCMAAGDSPENALTSRCLGETGLRSGETDTSEDAGCADEGDNAWLAPLKVEEGEKYMILISNVTSSGPGFSIRFSGSAQMPCDVPEKKPRQAAKKPAVTPAKAKPLEKPKASVASSAKIQPDSIGGRAVKVSRSLAVKNRKIKVKLWDSQVEDGDIVSVYLDDKKVIDHVYLRLKPQEYEIELPPGKEHYLTVYADDFGKAEPNTAKVSVFDGVREQIIDLVAGRTNQESVKIVTD
ncbi:MAG: hypothetical protein H6565_04520 [Lewinellaceae bacterium]|nr:hypothetical protein [Lewinellaceae bacterium]